MIKELFQKAKVEVATAVAEATEFAKAMVHPGDAKTVGTIIKDRFDEYKSKKLLVTQQDKEVFLEALINPPEPNEALIKARKNYNEFRRTNQDGPSDRNESEATE